MKKSTNMQLMNSINFRFSMIVILLLVNGKVWSHDPTPPTLFDWMAQYTSVSVEVEVDLDSLIAGKFTTNEHKAKMRVFPNEDLIVELPLKISVRSKSRRRLCEFPPLKLNFKEGALEDIGLNRRDKYKLVTHCLDERGEEILLKEYLVYELYRLLTPVSLRAKLINISYLDTKSSERLETKALLLENEKDFASKYEGEMCDCYGTDIYDVDPYLYEQLAMFQYMIGNSDYDHEAERNIKFVQQGPDNPMIPVSYDFDFAALVNAPYVFPEQRNNRLIKRTYLGYPGNNKILDEVKQTFYLKKGELLTYVETFPYLSKRERKGILLYINKFYKQIEDPNFEMPYADGHF